MSNSVIKYNKYIKEDITTCDNIAGLGLPSNLPLNQTEPPKKKKKLREVVKRNVR